MVFDWKLNYTNNARLDILITERQSYADIIFSKSGILYRSNAITSLSKLQRQATSRRIIESSNNGGIINFGGYNDDSEYMHERGACFRVYLAN